MNTGSWIPAILAICAASQAGCFFSGSSLTTARTLAPGQSSHTITGSMVGRSVGSCEERSPGSSNECSDVLDDKIVPVPIPGYQFRAGVADRVELAYSAQFLGTAGFELKWNPIRTRSLDVAFAPSIYATWLLLFGGEDFDPGGAFALPAVVDLNLSRGLTLVPHGMAGFGVGLIAPTGDDARLVYGGGLGLDWRLTSSVAIHPDLSLTYVPRDDGTGSDAVPVMWGLFAIGVVLGDQPSFE